MARKIINLGTEPNDGTGDTARAAGEKINENFEELYSRPLPEDGTDGTDGTNGTDGTDGTDGANVTITVVADLEAFETAVAGPTELIVLYNED